MKKYLIEVLKIIGIFGAGLLVRFIYDIIVNTYKHKSKDPEPTYEGGERRTDYSILVDRFESLIKEIHSIGKTIVHIRTVLDYQKEQIKEIFKRIRSLEMGAGRIGD